MFKYFCQIFKVSLFLLIFCKPAIAQLNIQGKDLKVQFDSIRNNFPREKLYVHLDRSIYAPQDTLWFKAYLVDASLLEASKVSGLIYFEIIDSKGTNIQRICLPTAMGITWGGFSLKSDLYKPGNYTFRAYTNWMQNFGDVYIFKKEIKVVDFLTEEQTYSADKKPVQASKKANVISKAKTNDFDIQFLPEGGNWVAGRQQKIAFKAINDLGKGLKIEGEILDAGQNKIADFQSNDKGMGYFKISGNENERYDAIIRSGTLTKKQMLPKPSVSGSFLQVDNSYKSDDLEINMFSDLPDQEIVMIGQSRAILCFMAKLRSGKQYKTLKIKKSLFPTGVAQILLTDTKGRIMSQRNFFINHKDELNIKLGSGQPNYKTRDSISVNVKALYASAMPAEATFSVAITDDNQVKKDSLNDDNILSHFLLTSDLKGEIEAPGYYFSNFNEQKHNDLDALMLTQGWVHYNWESGKSPVLKAEKDFTISGRVTNMMNKPGVNAQILLLGTKKPLSILQTTTNSNGEFAFKDFLPLDSASYVIQVKNSKGKSGTLGFEINEVRFPPFLISNAKKEVDNNELQDSISTRFIATKNEEYKAAYRNGIALQEVKITGKKIIKGSKNLNGDGNADQTITEAELDKVAKRTLFNLVEENVKGFRRGTHRKSIVPDYFINSYIFRLIIDGIDVDYFYAPFSGAPNEHIDYIKGYMDFYLAEDIKGIEVMANKKYSNSYFNEFQDPRDLKEYAYIEVTTRSGTGPFVRHKANLYQYKPQFSYGNSMIFYSPKYTTLNKNDKKTDYRSTIYWNPNVLTNEQG